MYGIAVLGRTTEAGLAEPGRQMLGLHHRAIANDDCPLQGVAHFTHIARPGVVLKCVEHGLADPCDLSSVFSVHVLKQSLYQIGDVFFVFAQRWHVNVKNIEAIERSLRNSPWATASSGTLLVAARTRTSTVVSTLLPSRRSLLSSSTRSSLACVATGISPISSSSRVPPSASSKHPVRRSKAPVKAPFSWPNISLSIRVSGMAARLIGTNGLFRRGLSSWTVRATNSLPVPLAPVISTEAVLGATISMR